MAAGSVIQSLGKFRLPLVFQHSFLPPTGCQEMVFQDLSEEEGMEEEEDEDEEEEEREGMEAGGNPAGRSPDRTEQAAPANTSPREAEMTLQLLQFAERISDDIQRYFGRKNKEEDADSCNIYEDSCSPPLSGRVLYYTDLVRISQSGGPEEEDDLSDPHVQLDQQPCQPLCGKEGAEKLGPLAELFEYGLCQYLKEQASPDGRKLSLERKYAHVTPMQSRKLPLSFWKEPSPSPACVLNNNPPDFSDLLANWTSETIQEELNTSRELTSEMNRRVVDTDHFGGLMRV